MTNGFMNTVLYGMPRSQVGFGLLLKFIQPSLFSTVTACWQCFYCYQPKRWSHTQRETKFGHHCACSILPLISLDLNDPSLWTACIFVFFLVLIPSDNKSHLLLIITKYFLVSFRLLVTHYNDIIMSVMASQITSVSIVCSNIGPGTDQGKH